MRKRRPPGCGGRLSAHGHGRHSLARGIRFYPSHPMVHATAQYGGSGGPGSPRSSRKEGIDPVKVKPHGPRATWRSPCSFGLKGVVR